MFSQYNTSKKFSFRSFRIKSYLAPCVTKNDFGSLVHSEHQYIFLRFTVQYI